MPTQENRIMRVEERQSDLRVKVAGLEATSAHHTAWIEAHRNRASSIEMRQADMERRQADMHYQVTRLQEGMAWVVGELRQLAARLASSPAPAKMKRFELPAAVSILALAVLARWLGLDLSAYLPGAIR